MRSRILGELIGLARATEGNEHLLTPDTYRLVAVCLTSEVPEEVLLTRIDEEKHRLVPMCFACASPCGRTNAYDTARLAQLPENLRSMKETLLEGCRKIAAVQPEYEEKAAKLLYRALYAIGMEDWQQEQLQSIIHETSFFLLSFSLL